MVAVAGQLQAGAVPAAPGATLTCASGRPVRVRASFVQAADHRVHGGDGRAAGVAGRVCAAIEGTSVSLA